MKGEAQVQSVDLKDFFSATDAREDRWQQLHTTARALCLPRTSPELLERAHGLLAEIQPLESYWAYPGPALLGEVRELGSNGDAMAFARLTERISKALLRGSYRHDPSDRKSVV